MKSALVIIGVLCLLLFSSEGIIKTHNYSSRSLSSGLLYYECSTSDAYWDFEESQNITHGLSEEIKSFKKRRNYEVNSRISSNIQGNCQVFSIPLFKAVSKLNLFIIYHFSLSLWQVFIQRWNNFHVAFLHEDKLEKIFSLILKLASLTFFDRQIKQSFSDWEDIVLALFQFN